MKAAIKILKEQRQEEVRKMKYAEERLDDLKCDILREEERIQKSTAIIASIDESIEALGGVK